MEWIAAFEQSFVGAWMRSSPWAYPLVHWLHVVGLVLLLGSMLMLDLRILGAGRAAITLRTTSQLLTPFAIVGLLIMLMSGLLLFSADGLPLIQNPLFLPKMGLVALGITNALLFRWLWRAAVEAEPSQPILVRVQAVVSLLAWVSAATLGRLSAYV